MDCDVVFCGLICTTIFLGFSYCVLNRWIARAHTLLAGSPSPSSRSVPKEKPKVIHCKHKCFFQSGLCKRVLVQVAYAIGGESKEEQQKENMINCFVFLSVAKPLSVYLDTYGTGTKTDAEVCCFVCFLSFVY